MTNGQHKSEMESKVKVKPYCSKGGRKKKKEPERAEFGAWPTAWSWRQKPVAASALPSTAAEGHTCPLASSGYVYILEAYILFETYP